MPMTKAELKAYNAARYQANREERLAYQAAYRQTNRLQIRVSSTAYNEANRQRVAERKAAARLAKLLVARRAISLADWKRWGCKPPWPYTSLELYYDEHYIVETHCEYCGADFSELAQTCKRRPRRMDHDHNSPFLVRAVCCQRCNGRRGVWDRKITLVHGELMAMGEPPQEGP